MLTKSERYILTIIFIMVSILLVGDIYEDIQEGSSLAHVIKESFVMMLGLIGLLVLWAKYFVAKSNNLDFKVDIQKLKSDLNHYKTETLHLSEGLGNKINEQLIEWKFTKSEKDVSLLLLKGLSIRDISIARDSSEKTIKQHCTNLYQKANNKGRSELSAFFLEDILVLK